MAGKIKLSGKYAKIANKMLFEVTSILENNKIPYVLEAGTLLGIIRENRLLPWDNDLDITITRKHASKLLNRRYEFWKKGYRTRIRKFKEDRGPLKKGKPRILKIQTTKLIFLKDISLMDIFIKKLIDDEYVWTVSDKNPVLKSCPRKFYDEKIQYQYRNKKYWIPKDYKDYLTYHYGNWHKPVKKWNFRTDDKCKKKIL